ncbi:MAG: hypothetical protein JWR02_181 [Mucilaginibacter sp.]|nr:hypothetical protein [Mucilaginibacter sp.]
MKTAAKREKLHDFVDSAYDLQVKAIYGKIEDYITRKSSDSIIKMKKMDVMKQALNHPLFLAERKEVKDDFDAIK